MCNIILQTLKRPFFILLLFLLFTSPLYAQQYIITRKDNTNPETSRQFNSFNLTSFNVIAQNGYNEIQWQAPANAAADKFIVEYSFDGINFLSGVQVLSNNGMYKYKHYIQDTRPLLYRVRVEHITGAISHSGVIFPEGITISPVQIHKNVVNGNIVNATAQLPVERVTIVSGSGAQLFTKQINGLKDFIPIAIPSLSRGIYFMTFYGNGWKSTSKILIG